MNVYFAGSIRGGRKDAGLYKKLITYIGRFAVVLTEHVGDSLLTAAEGESYEPRYIHDRDVRWLSEADVVIAEVSTPSLGVGYEIAQAVRLNKKVLCLYHQKKDAKLSAMIAGCPDIQIIEYNGLEEAKRAIDSFFQGGDNENHGK